MSSPQRDEVSAHGEATGGASDDLPASPPADGGFGSPADGGFGSGTPGRSGTPGGFAAGGAAGSGLAGSGFGTDGGAGGSGEQAAAKSPWKATPDGRTVFRRGTPFVMWWIWVAFLIFNVADVIIPDHDYFSLELLAGLLALTGVAYATALRPRVIASADGVIVHNPVQDHLVRWGAVNAVYLGDSVELSCARPAPRKDKTIYCWALYSSRRARMKHQQLGVRSLMQLSSRAPAEARELASQDAAQLMAAELGRRATTARGAGAPPATLESRWAWLPLAAMFLPAAAFLGLLLAR